MLTALFIAIIFAGIVLLGYVALLPSAFTYERSIVINASAERVFPFVNDFKLWSRWSPWEKRDANLQRTYSEPSGGEGAVYHWHGNKQVGEGEMRITKSVPHEKVLIDLTFITPIAAQNKTIFTLTPEAEGTRVTWTMTGNNNFVMRLFSLVLNMKKALEKDFDGGLIAMQDAVINKD